MTAAEKLLLEENNAMLYLLCAEANITTATINSTKASIGGGGISRPTD